MNPNVYVAICQACDERHDLRQECQRAQPFEYHSLTADFRNGEGSMVVIRCQCEWHMTVAASRVQQCFEDHLYDLRTRPLQRMVPGGFVG